MEALIQALRTLQANAFIYYTKAHGYHWNIEGILFTQFHEFFADIYNDAWSSIDGYAEWIRIFGGKAAFDTPSILMNSNVRYDLDMNASNPIDMLNSLNSSNDQIISDLTLAFDIATLERQQGVANFFADRISIHEKYRWQITASLKTMSNN